MLNNKIYSLVCTAGVACFSLINSLSVEAGSVSVMASPLYTHTIQFATQKGGKDFYIFVVSAYIRQGVLTQLVEPLDPPKGPGDINFPYYDDKLKQKDTMMFNFVLPKSPLQTYLDLNYRISETDSKNFICSYHAEIPVSIQPTGEIIMTAPSGYVEMTVERSSYCEMLKNTTVEVSANDRGIVLRPKLLPAH